MRYVVYGDVSSWVHEEEWLGCVVEELYVGNSSLWGTYRIVSGKPCQWDSCTVTLSRKQRQKNLKPHSQAQESLDWRIA